MKKIKWIFVVFAVFTATCMMGIGVAVAESSPAGIFACIVALITVMGFGFKTKRKMREKGEL
ncbi:hypothetical protein CVD25_12915 [Bacillus canaveralius]|uniref:YlaF family protein n=1 Tax=Bacillus canaveralius TaxID=1403243 RepID=A0A2N5GNI5_9BACI|nr:MULTISPECIES: YlaF family protein [Bacillus]PLR84063.1 hypothetical protein CU635_07090 [Bacillus canaveralius]PLR87296.1 hypothetical protein CVD23_03565 [Bacillus sp. V33-4]PLR96291.1 hypothetical protein CVD25_12915 [Bacillus canaveralius]RSK53522.1 hypothetical protein EJA13_08095 [Bacillus canaveralius]